MNMTVSVVIPTYNGAAKLARTLDALLASEVSEIDSVEVIVVDDGSPIPAAPIVDSRTVPSALTLRSVRQPNAGPAAARNTGYRMARGEIVLFMDDDIVAPPGLIRQHVEAHRSHPQSVICGRCPLYEPRPTTPLFRCLHAFGWDDARDSAAEFVPIEIVSSGQISVERKMFADENRVYCDDVATPAAEEFELSYRLRERGIPVLLATRIAAIHNQSVAIESICRQQYKHAIGCAEVAIKASDTLGLTALRQVIQAHNGPALKDGLPRILKKTVKNSLSSYPARRALLSATRRVETLLPHSPLLTRMYAGVIGLYFAAGIRDGMHRFQTR